MYDDDDGVMHWLDARPRFFGWVLVIGISVSCPGRSRRTPVRYRYILVLTVLYYIERERERICAYFWCIIACSINSLCSLLFTVTVIFNDSRRPYSTGASMR
jgi:hypothetical protein